MAGYPQQRRETVTATRADLSGSATSLLIHNTGSNACAVGNDLVTYTNGFILAAGDMLQVELDAQSDKLYFVCDTGLTTTLEILEHD